MFSLLTLPVEIDSSRRGILLLREAGLIQIEQDEQGAKNVLTAAATAYIAVAVTAILTLLYYISLADAETGIGQLLVETPHEHFQKDDHF